MGKDTITKTRYPCVKCNTLATIDDMSAKFVCVSCVGRATIAAGKHSARVRRGRREAKEKQ